MAAQADKQLAKTKATSSTAKGVAPSCSASSSTDRHPLTGALKKSTEGPFQMNPYQIEGPKEGYEARTVNVYPRQKKEAAKKMMNKGLYVRVDMPGVEEENVKVTWDKKKVSFVGEAPKETDHEAGARYYRGELDFNSDPVEILHVKTDVKNGVLRMVLKGAGFRPGFSTSSNHFPGIDYSQNVEHSIGNLLLRLRSIPLIAPPVEVKGFYPFQVAGSNGTMESKWLCTCDKKSDSGLFMRIDMPDVPKEGLSMKVKDNFVYFAGEGVKGSYYDGSRRSYVGRFGFQCGCCWVKEVKGEIKAGVLRMVIKSQKSI
ncbi:putative 57 kDa heat shock protein isoform X1 [Coffea arabica]|uniref:57 kDa heat shock protein isoform X1 n=1 Tax=Coffea arabica TaxID=13443 RepID=A0ABM4VKX6_COFAR